MIDVSSAKDDARDKRRTIAFFLPIVMVATLCAGNPTAHPLGQDHKRVLDQETIEGHAVRATLLCSGMEVWVAETIERTEPLAPPTAASLAKPSASHCCQTDTLSGLRLEVQLQPGWSGGILEWRVE